MFSLKLKNEDFFFTYNESKQVAFGGSGWMGTATQMGPLNIILPVQLPFFSSLLYPQTPTVNFTFVLTKGVINLHISLRSNLYSHYGFIVSHV